MSEIKIVAVIPARIASTRYPGKPLIDIKGLLMIEHVRRRTLLCQFFPMSLLLPATKKYLMW